MPIIHVNLIGDEIIDQDYDAIIKDNIIEYDDKDVHVTITNNHDHVIMKRSCDDYLIELNLKFGINKSYYQVFGSSKIFELETNVTKCNISKETIEIDYDLEGNKFQFKMEVK